MLFGLSCCSSHAHNTADNFKSTFLLFLRHGDDEKKRCEILYRVYWNSCYTTMFFCSLPLLSKLQIGPDLLTILHATAVKSLLLHIYLAHRDWLPSGSVSSMHQASVEQLLFSFVGKVLHKDSTICLCLWPVNLTSTCFPLPRLCQP